MDRDWSKASPELAWALSAAVTVIAVIIGGVYSWHRRRNAVNTEESVQVQWPSDADPRDPFDLKNIAAESKRIAAERRAAGLESDDIMDFPFCPILTAAGNDLAQMPEGASCPFKALKARQDTRKAENDANDDEPKEEMRDPIEFCNHIPSEIRKTTQKVAMKKIEEEMSEDQKQNEREIQRQQLEAIFKLMAEQEEKFGINNMDDMQEQMKLYTA